MESLALLFLFPLSLCLYLYFLYSNFQKKSSKKGFKIYPLVGALPEFLINRHRFLDWTTEVLQDCPSNTAFFHRPGNVHGIITASPEIVEHILKNNFENYPKGDRSVSILQDFLGTGIFNSDGEMWRLQRKIASYEFNTKSLRIFIMDSVKIEISTRLIPLLERASKLNQELDLQEILERFAFDNICKLAFNVDPCCLGGDGVAVGEFMKAFEEATTLSARRFLHAAPFLWKISKFFNIGEEKSLQKSIKIVHEFADEIIKSRIAKRTENQNDDLDLLSRFIQNDDSNSPEFLRDIVISFILAGRDTTSAALTWFFWLLSSNPQVERKILNELESIRARTGKITCDGETFSFEELKDMNYLQAAISESMRLYPPVPVDTRACKNEDVFPDGTFIGKNWFVAYHMYAMGRMERLWGESCCEYLPERWLDDDGVCRQESPFKFPVFNAGPRICLGKDMAYIQMKSIAAAVIERFHIDVNSKEKCPEHVLAMTLRMKGGLQIKAKERCY
ncbi:cytochrome P450 CYP94D108-like [Euphorbia lathyris]|uniref:cytochrome P450 CYP94D108-like n=1 Tax=Euphorbia lathyris TaxID=212925 RepID=UPI0033138170